MHAIQHLITTGSERLRPTLAAPARRTFTESLGHTVFTLVRVAELPAAAPPAGQGRGRIGDGLQANEEDGILILHRSEGHEPVAQNELGGGIGEEHLGAGFGDGFAIRTVDVLRQSANLPMARGTHFPVIGAKGQAEDAGA